MSYLVEILVRHKKSVLNAEARVIEETAHKIGYNIKRFDSGKYFSYVSVKRSKKEVEEEAKGLCKKFLSNPIIEDYKIISIKKDN